MSLCPPFLLELRLSLCGPPQEKEILEVMSQHVMTSLAQVLRKHITPLSTVHVMDIFTKVPPALTWWMFIAESTNPKAHDPNNCLGDLGRCLP